MRNRNVLRIASLLCVVSIILTASEVKVKEINEKEEHVKLQAPSINIMSSVEQEKLTKDVIDIINKTPLPTIKPTEVVKVKENKVNENDVYSLAQLIYSENGISCSKCKLLTGIVVMKRVKSKQFPNTIEGVISQKGQYAVYSTGAINCKPDDVCINIARDILENELEKNYPDELVFQAEFYQGRSTYFHCGNQYFCLS